MLPLTIPTICMSLVAGALAGKAEVFVREGGSYPDTPDLTVSAYSETICSINCVAEEKWRCGVFRYLANGTCLLYQETKESAYPRATETPPQEGDTAPDRSAIYRRPPLSGCPGLSLPLFQSGEVW